MDTVDIVNYSHSKTSLTINIIIHTLILFIFLSVFFFNYISMKEQEALNRQVDILSSKIPDILNLIKERDTNKFINWKVLKQKAQEEIQNDDLDIDSYIQENNKNLKYISIIIILSLFILTLSIYLYNNYILDKKIDMLYIIKENIVIFIFIGLIEFLFFKNVASKYVPIFPVEISTTILERIKGNIMDME